MITGVLERNGQLAFERILHRILVLRAIFRLYLDIVDLQQRVTDA